LDTISLGGFFMGNLETYENFIQNHELCDFQQSMKWGNVKEYWKNEIIALQDKQGNIQASMSILIRKVPLFGNLMYVPRGPVGDIHQEEIFQELTTQMRKMARKYKAFVAILEPNIKKEDEEFIQLAKKLNYQIYSKAVNFHQEIQARHNFRLALENRTEEEIFRNFSSKTRYNIRLAIKKGVVVKERKEEGLDEFYQLMQETGKRDHFRIRPKEYFATILREFPEEANLYIAYYQDKPVAGIMPIQYGNKMWYLYGASGNEHRNCMATYLLQWEMIRLAKSHDCKLYDFRGVCMDQGEEGGLYRFKKGFGGELVELIGEIYIAFHPIQYILYKITKRLYDKIARKIYELKNRIKDKQRTRKGPLLFCCKKVKIVKIKIHNTKKKETY